MRMAAPPTLPPPRPRTDAATDPATEASAVARALEAVAADLTRRAADASGEAADILEALAMIADDPMLLEDAQGRTQNGMDAAHALDAAFAQHRDTLAALGGYLAERAADLDDLKHRAVAFALGLPMPGLPSPGHPYVLVAEDLSPADTAGLGPDVLALVTERGGPTSHTAILARGRGLPAVVACKGIMDVPDGTVVGVDGRTGELAVGLTEREAAEVQEADRAERARLAAGRGPGRTADGHPVKLLLNIGSAGDLRPGAEGVGLFRTEFLFLDRTTAPSFEEQVAAYAEVFAQAESVIVRTLDAGTDKPLPFLGLPGEPNPALGVRGLRVDRLLPDVLETQLDAIAEAARKVPERLSIAFFHTPTPRQEAPDGTHRCAPRCRSGREARQVEVGRRGRRLWHPARAAGGAALEDRQDGRRLEHSAARPGRTVAPAHRDRQGDRGDRRGGRGGGRRQWRASPRREVGRLGSLSRPGTSSSRAGSLRLRGHRFGRSAPSSASPSTAGRMALGA
jgi:hypothetical protein